MAAGFVVAELDPPSADFDDDSGQVRVSVTNSVQIYNQGATAVATAGVSMVSYDVSILAVITPPQ